MAFLCKYNPLFVQSRFRLEYLDYSIKITKNKIPTVSDPYITVEKIKKTYECGDTLNTDDLTVTYYNSDGTAERAGNCGSFWDCCVS